MTRTPRKSEADKAAEAFAEVHQLPYGRGFVGLRKRPDNLFEVCMYLDGVLDASHLTDTKRRAINFMMDAHAGACTVLHMQDKAARRAAA